MKAALILLVLASAIGFLKAQASRPRRATEDFAQVSKAAEKAREADRIEEAIALYQKALKLNPRWAEGWWYLGTIYYDGDLYREAQAAFKNLVGLDPKLGSGWAMMGLCEFQMRDYANSLVHLQYGRARGLSGQQEMIRVVRYHEALLLIQKGDFESATELLSSLVQYGVVSNNVRVALGLALLRVPLLPEQIDPSKDALIHAAGGAAELIATSNFDQADVTFHQIIRDYPNTPFIRYAYGSMLASLSRYEQAEDQLQEEMKVTPESALPYMQLAYVYLRTYRYRDARPLGQKAVELAPHAFAAHYLLGRAMLESGDVSGAVRELMTARRLGPYSPEVRYNLARALAKAKRPAEAARERNEFERLNALLERSRAESSAGQSYRSSSERGELEPHQVREPPAPPPK